MEQSVCKVEVGRDKHLSRRIAIVVLLIAALALPACTSVIGKRDESGGKLRVGIVFDIGGKDDKSFNAAAWEGVKRAKDDTLFALIEGVVKFDRQGRRVNVVGL